MKTLLITDVDGVAGSNLAAVLSDHYRIFTVGRTVIPGCTAVDESRAIAEVISTLRPAIIVHCGPGAESSWSASAAQVSAADIQITASLCEAADSAGSRVVFLSSDMVYRGPWMFHSEDSECLAADNAAINLVQCESAVLANPQNLVLRTNILGWSPAGQGVVESLMRQLELGRSVDFGHHATPVSASCFASIIETVIEQELSGLFNFGGAERTTPFGVAAELAERFGLPQPVAATESLARETTMQCRQMRRVLNVALPTLAETIEELCADREERLAAFGLETPLAAAA